VTRGFMGPLGGFWPKLGRKRVTGWKQRSCVPPGRVKTNKQTYKIMMGKIVLGTYKIMMGKIVLGTYKIMMGKIVLGTYKFMMGTYKMQVMHKFVLVYSPSTALHCTALHCTALHSNTTKQNCNAENYKTR
jgi:hypothetical protein